MLDALDSDPDAEHDDANPEYQTCVMSEMHHLAFSYAIDMLIDSIREAVKVFEAVGKGVL